MYVVSVAFPIPTVVSNDLRAIRANHPGINLNNRRHVLQYINSSFVLDWIQRASAEDYQRAVAESEQPPQPPVADNCCYG